MHTDDRLSTVLRHRATGPNAHRTQYRQLLDLLGSSHWPAACGNYDMGEAWQQLGWLSESIPADERARIVADPGLRIRNPELAFHLMQDDAGPAAAVIAKAELDERGWEALIPRMPVRARGFLRLRRDLSERTMRLLDDLGVHDRGLPRPDDRIPAPAAVAPALRSRPELSKAPIPPVAANDRAEETTDDSAIGILVKRIEAYRKLRSNGPADAENNSSNADKTSPSVRTPETARPIATSFGFTTDGAGRVDWADDRFGPMLIGTRLDGTVLGPSMKERQPIRGKTVELHGGPAIAGDWIIDAAPRFTKPDGRFFGYAALARRARSDAETARRSSDGDRIRQMLHELRTPVNAIQGFAEFIQQQLFGPAPHEYRALAASIAGDSARILAGFDELARLAMLETGALEIDGGASDLASIVAKLVDQFGGLLEPRTAGLDLVTYNVAAIAMDENETEAMAWRLLATLTAAIGVGEHIQLEFDTVGENLILNCELPLKLAAKDDIFEASTPPSDGTLNTGMFGAGFALRLVRAEANAIGGSLTRADDWLTLALPLAIAVGGAIAEDKPASEATA